MSIWNKYLNHLSWREAPKDVLEKKTYLTWARLQEEFVCPGSEWGRVRGKTQRRRKFPLGHHLPKMVVVVTDR